MADDTSTTDNADTGDTGDTGPATGTGQADANGQRQVPPEVSRALKAANKEAETLRRKLKEIEDRDKTEAQKLAERAEAAEKRAAEIEARALRLEVATEKGLTPRQVKWLTGTTREELEANADEIREEFSAAKEADRAPVFNGGPRKTAGSPANMNDLIRSRTGRG